MLIPFGIFGASGAGNPGAYEQIATAFGTGSSNVITFSSIPQTYKHLQIRVVGKTTTGSTEAGLFLRFNNDSLSNYRTHWVVGNGTSLTSIDSAAATDIWSYQITGSTNANIFGAAIIDILDYSSVAKNKVTKTLGGYAGIGTFQNKMAFASGLWNNAAAINTIQVLTSGNFITASRVSLYGIKGA
jgi:hypothetical protein